MICAGFDQGRSDFSLATASEFSGHEIPDFGNSGAFSMFLLRLFFDCL